MYPEKRRTGGLRGGVGGKGRQKRGKIDSDFESGDGAGAGAGVAGGGSVINRPSCSSAVVTFSLWFYLEECVGCSRHRISSNTIVKGDNCWGSACVGVRDYGGYIQQYASAESQFIFFLLRCF